MRKRAGMEDVGLLESESESPAPARSTRKNAASAAGSSSDSSKADGSGAAQEPSVAETVWSSVTGMMGFGGRDDTSGGNSGSGEGGGKEFFPTTD